MNKKLKKTISVFFVFLTLAALLTGCASNKLSDDYEEEEVKAKAEEVIALANAKDYEAITALVPEELQAMVSAKDLEAAWDEKLTACGEFTKFSKEIILGQAVKETGEDLAVAVIVADYENDKAQFTLSFNKDLALVGYYMK